MKHRLLILAAAVVWSTAGAAIKFCSATGWQIASGRSAIAGLVLLVALRSARRRPTAKVLRTALAYAATVLLFSLANKATTAANAIFLQSTAPVYVLALSPWLLKERPTRGELLCVPIFLAGLVLFFFDRLGPGQQAGNLIALASGVAFALALMGLRGLQVDDGIAAVTWGNFVAAGLALPFALLGPALTGTDVGAIAFLGVFQLALGYVLFQRGIQGTSATQASVLVLLEPVLNPIWSFLLAGERPGPWALCGGAIILVASLVRALQPAAKATAQPAAPTA